MAIQFSELLQRPTGLSPLGKWLWKLCICEARTLLWSERMRWIEPGLTPRSCGPRSRLFRLEALHFLPLNNGGKNST